MKVKAEIHLPDNCFECGGRLAIPSKKRRVGKHLRVERPCVDCKKLDIVQVQVEFTEEDRAILLGGT